MNQQKMNLMSRFSQTGRQIDCSAFGSVDATCVLHEKTNIHMLIKNMSEIRHILSIITVAFNERRHVDRLQKSILVLKRPGNISIESVLIDGGSGDGTADAARVAGFTRVIEYPGASIPVCRNKGLETARGDWIAFVDADCELTPDWLEQALPFLDKFDTVMIGWPAQPPEPMTWVQAAWHFHWTHKNARFQNVNDQLVIQHEGFRLATTRNMLFHKMLTKRIGAFNEELVTGEDTDFAFRAYIAGIPVLGIPSLKVIHHGEPATLSAFFKQQLWHANRKSYKHIYTISGGRVGANAPRFALAFTLASFAFIAGIALATILHQPTGLALSLPLPLLIMAPALRLCLRAKNFKPFAALCVLYAAYGLARSMDLLGFASAKPSWKLR